jgi:RNA polymerase sigma-70 factor, ECF subfamily
VSSHTEQLDDAIENIVRRVAVATYRARGPLAIDDLIQIGWVAAREALISHDGRTLGSYSYIAQAVRWRILDAYRHEAQEPQVTRSEREFHEIASALDRRDFSDRAVRRLDLARAMKRLRPDYRRVLFEVQVLDRPYDEVAAECGITLGALKSLHHRALEQLRQIDRQAA